MRLKNFHLLIGGLGLFLFVLQGQYMLRVLDVPDMPDAARMMYRSAHLYLLLGSTANVCFGVMMAPAIRQSLLQRLASLVLLASPALLLWSFFTESTSILLERPVASMALYLLFGATVALLLDEGYRRFRG